MTSLLVPLGLEVMAAETGVMVVATSVLDRRFDQLQGGRRTRIGSEAGSEKGGVENACLFRDGDGILRYSVFYSEEEQSKDR